MLTAGSSTTGIAGAISLRSRQIPDGLGIWVSGENVAPPNTWATEVSATYNNYTPFGGLSDRPLDFGNHQLFSVGGALPEIITNTGNASVLLGSVTLVGDADISIILDGCRFALLQPNAGCEMLVRLSPSSLGRHRGTFTALSNKLFQADTTVTGVGVQAGTTTSIAASPSPSTLGHGDAHRSRDIANPGAHPQGTLHSKMRARSSARWLAPAAPASPQASWAAALRR